MDIPINSPTSIIVASGTFVNLAKPDPATILLKDISLHLSRERRWSNLGVSVVEHSLLGFQFLSIPQGRLANVLRGIFAVNWGVPELQEGDWSEEYEAQFCKATKEAADYFLFHDAAEAYMRDLPDPLKRMCPRYLEIEESLLSVIYRKFLGCCPSSNILSLVDFVDGDLARAEGEFFAKLKPRIPVYGGWDFRLYGDTAIRLRRGSSADVFYNQMREVTERRVGNPEGLNFGSTPSDLHEEKRLG